MTERRDGAGEELGDGPLDMVDSIERIVVCRQHDEIARAVGTQEIVLCEPAAQHLGHCLRKLLAEVVAEASNDARELIDANHEHAHGAAVATRIRDDARKDSS